MVEIKPTFSFHFSGKSKKFHFHERVGGWGVDLSAVEEVQTKSEGAGVHWCIDHRNRHRLPLEVDQSTVAIKKSFGKFVGCHYVP
ncbi:hypothetical protein L6452_04210 [Arctium lappa]|uniref:Uncharacterized protein n=1 Tax=Arctium lappa TaxID=4217 RepID=A0ACB9FQE0_ARCLA|nr:hypothetical protein L6452_04210 [Arctium lappa]